MRLMERSPETLTAEGLAIAHRALPFLVLWCVLEVFVRGWIWLAFAAAGVGYFASLFDPQVGVWFPAAVLAIALVATPLVLAGAQLWCEVAFVRCLRRDEPAAVSLFESAGALSRSLASPVALWLITGLAGAMVSGAISGMAGTLDNPWRPGAPVLFALVTQLLAGAVAAFVPAVLEVARLHAFLALDLDSTGELPRPAPPLPVAVVLPAPPVALA
jgi:hypothetical protein